MIKFKDNLAVFAAGALGGLCRYEFSMSLLVDFSFPWGTLLVNWLGVWLLVWFVKGYLASRGAARRLVLALGTGFCGGLTTFSSLLLDSVKLLDKGDLLSLLIYLSLSILGGFAIALIAEKRVQS
ncbi:fluoride efflux transporter CrcB [Streptococcus massiliensis]|uniref:Fluoride-specific ion channel FluC n=1 Tax=Streptococcus massiliensis TaxID=313439 RepID=A0A380KXX3_9STRE|nr:fluoride efflux transporter CrcB [Streptococcus massiliensis]SUN76129.1 camphor resistance protein CrcB [Streptococcus massiliensis]